jgi:hypothetical protein
MKKKRRSPWSGAKGLTTTHHHRRLHLLLYSSFYPPHSGTLVATRLTF